MHAEPTPVALVTGTSTGIGLESAVALAHAGMRVVATLRDLEKSDALTARAAESGATSTCAPSTSPTMPQPGRVLAMYSTTTAPSMCW